MLNYNDATFPTDDIAKMASMFENVTDYNRNLPLMILIANQVVYW